MEIGIPLLALGGMYIIANKDKDEKNKQKEEKDQKGQKEGMTTPTPQQFIPTSQQNQVREERIQEQPHIQQSNELGNSYLLNESKFDKDTFQHNNMVPFNGGKVRGAVFDFDKNESILDSKIGYGSKHIRKEEQAPLFKPEESINLNYGSQNHSDFYQSRMSAGTQKNNIKPFESEMVGPGLDKGYNAEGTGGFNSGMDSRDKWKPYTVDELRVATNPKIEYELDGHQGPAMSHIINAPVKENLGRFEKNRPDRHFENSQDRWLTTNSSEKAATYRSEQQMGIVKREDKDTNYKGAAISDKKGPYSQQNFEKTKRNQLATNDITNSSARGRGPECNHDLPLKSHTNYQNNRSTTTHELAFGGVGGALGAVVAPIVDLFKPTLKQEVIENMRVYGDAKSSVSSNYVVDYNNKTKTTNKETTLYAPTFNMNKQGEASYVNNYRATDVTQRDATCRDYVGGVSSNNGFMDYNSAYIQTHNDAKMSTINNRINQGGTQMHNTQMNMTLPNKVSNVCQSRVNAPHMANFQTPSMQTMGVSKYSRESPDMSKSRLDDNLLKSFRENPYTHSLHSNA